MADNEIRSILAPLTNGYVLLPNSTVGEILEFSPPEPFKQGPQWLLGEIAWCGWQVPIVNYERLINDNINAKITSKCRIVIVKTLGESTQVNYIGILIQGLPKLKKITTTNLIEEKTDELPNAVFSEVSIDDLQTYIPDLCDLTRIVELAAYDN